MDQFVYYDAIVMLIAAGVLSVISLYLKEWFWLILLLLVGVVQIRSLWVVPPWWIWIHFTAAAICLLMLAFRILQKFKESKEKVSGQ